MNSKTTLKILVTAKVEMLDQIVPKLQKAGMKIASVLDAVGVVTGEIEAVHLAGLKKIPGVIVEEDKLVQLPDPDSPLQ